MGWEEAACTARRLPCAWFISVLIVFFVGDVETPPIGSGDVLLICSGSGKSQMLISHAKKAAENGAKVVLISCSRSTPLGELADWQVILSALQKDVEGEQREQKSILPMGSQFELASALFFENLVLEMMQEKHETNETMFRRHANLE
ncbi:MAG: SIS domain-containing protein [Lachnospiraceae bacterium]|nr:SIS domain-containing protein [Lachnospiraceae bacterium]